MAPKDSLAQSECWGVVSTESPCVTNLLVTEALSCLISGLASTSGQ